jgi:hypothetical protein
MQQNVSVLPNSFYNNVVVNATGNIQSVVVTDITGKIVYKADGLNETQQSFSISHICFSHFPVFSG